MTDLDDILARAPELSPVERGALLVRLTTAAAQIAALGIASASPDTGALLSVAQVAAKWHTSEWAVRKVARRMGGVRIGNSWRFDPADVQRYEDARRRRRAAEID